MTDRAPESPILHNPSGVPYPTTVQRFVDEHIDHGHIGFDHDPQRHALVHALEAAIAADREHRPEPELTQAQLDQITNVYAAGFGSGACTALMQGAPAEISQQIALMLLGRFFDDPAARLEMEDMARRTWTGELDQVSWHTVRAYPSPRNHRDD